MTPDEIAELDRLDAEILSWGQELICCDCPRPATRPASDNGGHEPGCEWKRRSDVLFRFVPLRDRARAEGLRPRFTDREVDDLEGMVRANGFADKGEALALIAEVRRARGESAG